MKRNYFRSFMFVALGTMIISCSKEEAEVVTTANTISEVKANQPIFTTPLSYRLPAAGDNHLRTPVPIQVEAPSTPYPPNEPFEVISAVTPAYIKETCSFDFSHLDAKYTYQWIKTKNLNISFGNIYGHGPNSFAKLTPAQDIYWTPVWGNYPAVQEKHPDVLFTLENEWMILVLGKPCTEFGFEIAPNQQNRDLSFYASFGNSTDDKSSGSVRTTARTPDGAKLVAIKATKPFTHITIGTLGNGPAYSEEGGFAIANLRYKLAK